MYVKVCLTFHIPLFVQGTTAGKVITNGSKRVASVRRSTIDTETVFSNTGLQLLQLNQTRNS